MKLQKSARAAIGIAALVCLLFMFLPFRLAAQIDTGGITGTVLDPSGAAVPGANITVTNIATDVRQATVSTATGNYSFNGLAPGTYTIEASAGGFQHYVVHGIVVHLQQTSTDDVHLRTGNVQQSVTVTATAPLLQAESGQVGQTVNNEAVENLPLNTRDWGSLAQLSAGVNTAPAGQPTPDSGSTEGAYFSVNGVNIWQNDFRLNGINDNIEIYGGNYTGTNAAIVPPPDAVQEFKVQTGDYSAAFGHSTGGVVNAAIKSGTNALHGDVWEYLRNDAFNANYFFNRTCSPDGVCTSKPIPEYRQNLFGVTAGGPIIKNRTFWFFDYQGGRYVLPSPSTSTVPTTGMTSGPSPFTNLQDLITYNKGTATDALGRVFPHGTIMDPATTREIPAGGTDPISGLPNTATDKNGNAIPIYVRDPFYNCTVTGCPAANYAAGGPLTGMKDFTSSAQEAMLNVIPTSREDQNAVKLLGVYPAQTSAGLTNNYTQVPKTVQNNNTWDIRIDENLNANNKLWGVYDRSLFTRNVPGNLPGLAVGQTNARTDSLPAYAWAVGYTRIFSPTLTNDMTVGMVHSDKLQQSTFGNTMGIPSQFGINGVQQVPNNGGIPPISINGLTHIGVGNYTPTLQYVWSLEGDDNVTKVYRNHTFQMGIEVDDMEGDISQPPQGRGDFNFNGQYTDIPNNNSNLTGIGELLVSPIPSLVAGGVDNVGGMSSFSGSNIAATDDHRWYWAGYFQDDWKATTNLTLNLGLRWDYFTPYAETRGRQANFLPAGGNGPGGVYEISTKGCQVPRSAKFDANLVKDGISLVCVPSLTLGSAQKTNFAPRLGFAYRVNPKMVVRGGFGLTYGALGNLGYGGTLGTNYPFVYVDQFNSPDSQHPITLSDGTPATMEHAFETVPLQDPTLNSGEGLNLYGRQNDFQTPYVETQNLTVQDQFTNHDSVQVGYVGTEGRHLDNLGYSNSNSEILPVGVNANVAPYIPFPDFNRNATYETTNATSSYNSLQITYEHQMSAGLYFLGNYTWGKCMTDQHTQAEQNSGYRAEWLPGFGIARDYALCDTDATHLVHTAASYDLPFGHGRHFGGSSSKAADLLLGGWTINGIYSFQSGQPFTIGCPTATTSDFGCFANLTGQNLYSGPHDYNQWLNPAAFAQPPKATTIGQTDLLPLGGGQMQARGPHWNNFDSSVLKDFHVTESVRVQFRAEAFNTTNTPPFGKPGQLNFTTTKFSNISSTLNSNGNNGARTLQFALKLFY